MHRAPMYHNNGHNLAVIFTYWSTLHVQPIWRKPANLQGLLGHVIDAFEKKKLTRKRKVTFDMTSYVYVCFKIRIDIQRESTESVWVYPEAVGDKSLRRRAYSKKRTRWQTRQILWRNRTFRQQRRRKLPEALLESFIKLYRFCHRLLSAMLRSFAH